MFYTHLALGACPRCNQPILVPAFSMTPISATTCSCFAQRPEPKPAPSAVPSSDSPDVKDRTPPALFAEELAAAVRYDTAVVEYQHMHLEGVDDATIESLLMRIASDLAHAQGAFLDGSPKATVSFLLRASATLRHLITHNEELRSVAMRTIDEAVLDGDDE